MKILMVAMRMDIGGAETHIVELSSALVNKGHTVTVASAGGVYATELKTRGIRHITLPLDRKTPSALSRSYRGLKKLILNEKYDIVHAHARIPAFLCGKLQKQLHFRFVTTCHARFRVTPLWRRLTYWGDHTFAVSEDIRRYLIEDYGVEPSHIQKIVNGIDTDMFSPLFKGNDNRQKFGIPDNGMILHVSRLEKESSICAEALIGAVELLPFAATLVIVGGGCREAELQKRAEAVNRKLGRAAVLLTGPRTDIADCIAACDIFVGPSRAAMEALACGKPTIVSGSEGHGGIFDEDLSTAAVSSNFCFRQSLLPTSKRLAEDISRLLTMDKEEKARLSAYGRAFITENYSVSTMLAPHLSVYSAISSIRTAGKPDIVICGYYGYGNAGDESMLACLIDGLRRIDPALCICVLSAHPKETKRRYLVDSVWRFNVFAVRKKLMDAKLFLFGGGNLLQDRTSQRSLMYYTEMISLAKRCGARIMVYANGIGPIDSPKNLDRVKGALSLADSISLRDKESFALCKSLVPEKNIRLTFDPAVTIMCPDANGVEKSFAVIPKKNTAEAFDKTVSLISEIRENYGLTPYILSLYNGEDLSYCRRLSLRADAPLFCCLSDGEIVEKLSRSALVISARLHGLIYATVACTPMMGFSDDCKLAAYLDTVGLGNNASISASATPQDREENLLKVADRLLAQEHLVRGMLKASLPTLRVMAEYEFQEAVHAVREEKI